MLKKVSPLYSHLPSCPGVYLMKNKEEIILYIGKSNNLKARVRSYFVPGTTLNFAKKKMIQHIHKVDFIETKSDIEALLLETNLIKTHQPKYNVLMKDGKNCSYLKITNDEIPCLVRTRIKSPFKKGDVRQSGQRDFVSDFIENPQSRQRRDSSFKKGAFYEQYFGPYSQYFDTYAYLRFVRRIFKLGNHDSLDGRQNTKDKIQNKILPSSRQLSKLGTLNFELGTGALRAPCMDTYIGLCPGHCTGDPEKIKIYLSHLKQAKEFLEGNVDEVLQDMRSKMFAASQKHEFEKASEFKQIIAQIEETGNRQIVRDSINGDALVIVSLEKYDRHYLGVLEIKNSIIVGVMEYALDNPLKETSEELLSQAVAQTLEKYKPKHILLSKELVKLSDVQIFSKEEKIKIHSPKRGEKVQLLEFAHTNLLNYAFKEEMSGLRNATLSKKTMEDLLTLLNLPPTPSKGGGTFPPLRGGSGRGQLVFECFDISHSHGEHTVASKSVLVNGKPDPKRYRKYRIKSLSTGKIDDFAAIEEVMTRRALAALRGEDPWPNLIVIDGGKGQLSAALKAVNKTLMETKNAFPSSSGESELPKINRGTKTPEDETRGSSQKKNQTWTCLPVGRVPAFAGMTEIKDILLIISLAKREEEVFLPGKSDPILLEKGSPELMLLQKIRDEAHRFAINYNRSSREKSYTKTLLDELPGIGPSARKKILSHVSRIEELASWNQEKAEKMFGKNIAGILADHGLIVQSY